VVREYKRRFGDTTPIIVAGSPYSAEALMARMLRAVVNHMTEQEGEAPSRIVVTHPANWGNYKRELLDQMVRLAGLDPGMVGFLTEPEAAAMSYAAQERVEPGEVVAVYDLGGGTFDAAVLRRTVSGFAILGRPEGIERLGGIDFDAAVFAHISASLGDALAQLDPADPSALLAVTRLRQDCVAAKEALSSDTDASIAVVLPGLHTEVRITRQEFENLIRPAVSDSLEAMRRANPVLLEPMMAVEVETPEDYAGTVMGDLASRRGHLQGMDDMPGGGKVIKAEVPLSEMFGYSTSLRSATQGRATYTMEFKHYSEAPKNVAEAIINQKAAA